MIDKDRIFPYVSVVSLFLFFLFNDMVSSKTIRSFWIFISVILVSADFIYRLSIARAGSSHKKNLPRYVSFGFGAAALLLYFLRSYLDFPPAPGTTEETSFLPKIRDFLLVLIVILSFAFLLYTVLLDISGKSMAAQGIGTEKYNLLQSSFQNLLIILPLLIAINYIAVKRNYNFDLSSAGKFSFSSISRSILKKVKKEVQVVAFYPRPLEASGPGNTLALTLIRPEIEIILDQLKSINSNFSVKFINADVETDLLGDFGQVSNGTILIRSLKENATGKNPYAEQRVSVQEQTDLEDMERKIVQAVLTVSSEEKNIYFTTLNGERFGPGFTNVPNEQLNKLVAGLNFVNFKANPLGVEQNWPNAIPNDANAIAVIGPTISLSKETREILMKYITERNGKLLITIDPRGTEDFTWLLEKSDVIFKKDALSQFDSRPGIIVTKNFQKHPIEESLEKKSTGVVFPYSGYFEMNPAVTKERLFERKTFLESGQETFKDLNNNGKMDNKESKANLILGITLSIEKKKPSDPKQSALKNEQKPEDAARIVIYSGTSWLTDQYFTYNANPGLAVNSASWLLEKEPIAGIVSKKEEAQNINLTDEQKLIVWMIGMFAFPGFVIGAGSVFVFMRRKKNRIAV